MTARNNDEMVAYALEIDPALLAFVTELLADFRVLGADEGLIVEAHLAMWVTGLATREQAA